MKYITLTGRPAAVNGEIEILEVAVADPLSAGEHAFGGNRADPRALVHDGGHAHQTDTERSGDHEKA